MTTCRIFPDDTFIDSYPKSGNTWVRFFVSNLLRGDGLTDFVNLDRQVPDIYKVAGPELESLPRPRFLKSHEPFDPSYPRVLYLVRDVRSVASSFYRQKLRVGAIPKDCSIKEFVEAFVAGRISRFGAWDDHVKRWLDMGSSKGDRFLAVKYEDMVHDGPAIFRRIASFLGINRSEECVQQAFELSRFHRMRKLERQAGSEWVEKRNTGEASIPFVHSGKVDSWRSDLDFDSQQLLVGRYGDLLSALGYEV